MFSKKRQNSVPYLERLVMKAKSQGRIREIEAAIAQKGFWEDFVEWRISTVTEMRIDPIEKDGQAWFKVRVVCDHEMICHCPTIERAIEFLGLYERLIADLFWTLGWPSWAAADKPEP